MGVLRLSILAVLTLIVSIGAVAIGYGLYLIAIYSELVTWGTKTSPLLMITFAVSGFGHIIKVEKAKPQKHPRTTQFLFLWMRGLIYVYAAFFIIYVALDIRNLRLADLSEAVSTWGSKLLQSAGGLLTILAWILALAVIYGLINLGFWVKDRLASGENQK